jgi:uncharacterized membrane protein
MFRVLLAIHILAAVVFIGNVITAAFWKVRADRSGDLDAIARTTRAVLQADYVFTLPGILGVVVTGFLMVGMTGWERFQEPWLAASLALVVLVGLLWAAVLLPLQLRMVRLARLGLEQGARDPAYDRASRLWAVFGGIATLLPVVVLFLMVLRPGS